MKKIFILLATLFSVTANAQNINLPAPKYYIDISADSVKQLMLSARTPEDSLYAIVATLDNYEEIDAQEKLDVLVNILVRLNNRLKLIDTTPYELFRDGLKLWENNEKMKCIEKLKESIEAFDRQEKILGSNSLFIYMRTYFSYAGLQEEKFTYYRDKLQYYQENGPIENTAACYHAMAGPYSFKADYNNAINCLLKSAEVFKSFSPWGYCNEICAIGKFYNHWGNYEKAEYYLQMGYTLSLKINSWTLAVFTKAELAFAARKKKDYKRAMEHIEEALIIISAHNVTLFKAICLAEKGGILIEMSRPDDAYHILSEAMAYRDSINMPMVTASGNFEGDYYLYQYYHLKGDYSQSEKQLLSAYNQAIESKYDILILKYGKELAAFYSETGKPEKAIPFALSYITCSDSLRIKQNRYNIAEYEKEQKALTAYKELQRQKLVRNGFIGGFAAMLLFAGVFFTQRNKIKKGKRRSDELLLNILPAEVAEELKAKGSADAKQFDEVTVMFTDFKGFTQISEKLSATELVNEIHTCFKAFDEIISKNNIEKIKTIGDAYMCAGGLPVANTTHANDVVKAAMEIQTFMQRHKEEREKNGLPVFEIRIGVNTGSVVAGIVGVKKFAYDIWGDTVNIASRMESSGEAGKVNISGSTYNLVKDKFNCVHRGKIEAKNKGEIDMYFVEQHIE